MVPEPEDLKFFLVIQPSDFMMKAFVNSVLMYIVMSFASFQYKELESSVSYTQQTIMDGDIPRCSSPRCTVSNKAFNQQLNCM